MMIGKSIFDALEEMVIETASICPDRNGRRMAEAVRDATHIFLRNLND